MDPFLIGLALGVGAGVSPGPLFVLVVTSALRSGWRAGALAALAPVVSDLVVVAGVLLVLDLLPDRALPVLAVAGGLFLLWTAFVTVRRLHRDTRGLGREMLASARRAGGLLAASPHPYASGRRPDCRARQPDHRGGPLVGAFYIGTREGPKPSPMPAAGAHRPVMPEARRGPPPRNVGVSARPRRVPSQALPTPATTKL